MKTIIGVTIALIAACLGAYVLSAHQAAGPSSEELRAEREVLQAQHAVEVVWNAAQAQFAPGLPRGSVIDIGKGGVPITSRAERAAGFAPSAVIAASVGKGMTTVGDHSAKRALRVTALDLTANQASWDRQISSELPASDSSTTRVGVFSYHSPSDPTPCTPGPKPCERLLVASVTPGGGPTWTLDGTRALILSPVYRRCEALSDRLLAKCFDITRSSSTGEQWPSLDGITYRDMPNGLQAQPLPPRPE